jgi:hypothetical protein
MSEFDYGPDDFVDVDARDHVDDWSKSEKWVGCYVELITLDGQPMRYLVVGKNEVDEAIYLEGRREFPPPTPANPGSARFEPRHISRLWEERRRS